MDLFRQSPLFFFTAWLVAKLRSLDSDLIALHFPISGDNLFDCSSEKFAAKARGNLAGFGSTAERVCFPPCCAINLRSGASLVSFAADDS